MTPQADIEATVDPAPRQSAIRRFLSSLTGRLLVSAVIWSGLALAVGGVVLSFSFRSYVLSDVDKRLEILLDTLIGISEVSPAGEFRLNQALTDQRFSAPYSGWYWQVSEAGAEPVRSRSLWDYALDPNHESRTFSLRYSIVEGPDGQTLRLAEHDIILPEADRVFHYQVATNMAEVHTAIGRFNWLLLIALGVILLTVSLALVIQVGYGLRPLRTLQRDLADVRAGRSQRLGETSGKLPEDIQPLVDEVNGLIEQNEKLVQRARTHVGNLAHALKTPLSVIQNTAEGMNDTAAETIRAQSRDMLVHIDHHLKRARIAGGGSGAGLGIKDRLEKLIAAVSTISREKNLRFDLVCQSEFLFDGEKQDFDEMMGNLIENASKWAETKISVSVRRLTEGVRRPMLEVVIEDDGPGVPENEREALFKRGHRLDEHTPGTGLGLAIVQDIADMYGGAVRLDAARLGGLGVHVMLPAK